MQQYKYYDKKNDRPLNQDLDGCALVDWEKVYGKALFARHPKGFKIFLSPDKLAASDEYAVADPYEVKENIDSEFHARRYEVTIELLREAVGSRQGAIQILDLGCGQGHITEKMRLAIQGAECTGLDYSVSAIEYAHENFPQIDFAVADAYESPYAKEFFDVVVCNNLWEHVPDPLVLLSKIKQLLKPAGYLIVSTPSRYRLGNLARVLRGKPVIFMSKHHVTEYSVGQVIEQLAYGGFRVMSAKSRPTSATSAQAKIARWVLEKVLSLADSHHQLESTVFYLAQREPGTAIKAN